MRLHNGQRFPPLSAPRIGGGRLSLPEDFAGSWGVVLCYRGHWCPYCRQQLVDFQRSFVDFQAAGVRLAAISTDSEEDARRTVEQHQLEFPVGYGLDARVLGEQLGAYVHEAPSYVQATGFVLDPEHRIWQLVYSSGPMGRLVARDTLLLIKHPEQMDRG